MGNAGALAPSCDGKIIIIIIIRAFVRRTMSASELNLRMLIGVEMWD